MMDKLNNEKASLETKPELLAPAGSIESIHAAVHAGADAVYFGAKRFSARQYAKNFDTKEIIEGIDYCHLYGVKAYITVNTLVKDSEFENAMELVYDVYEVGADAVIVQDLGLAMLIKENLPDLSLHASTQMTVHNIEGAKYLEDLGFDRVILARELSLEEIREITKSVKIGIETFVHGALCYGYSGQCLLSSLIGGRSGNRGRCAQPCRKYYQLLHSGKKVYDGYLMSTKDMCLIDKLKELADAGIKSFKIEGRMKRPEYVSAVVSAYRDALDFGFVDKEKMDDISKIFTRGFSSGHYYGLGKGKEGMNHRSPENQGLRLGIVRSYDEKNGILSISANRRIEIGEGIEIWGKGDNKGDKRNSIGFQVRKIVYANWDANWDCDYKNSGYNFGSNKNHDNKNENKKENKKNGNKKNGKKDGGYVEILVPRVHINEKDVLCKGAEVYITSSPYALERARARIGNRRVEVRIGATCIKNKKLKVWMEDGDGNRVEVSSENEIETAKKIPTGKDEIEKQLRKLSETPFFAKDVVLEYDEGDEGIFIPFGVLNSIKKECVNLLIEARKKRSKRKTVRKAVKDRLNKINSEIGKSKIDNIDKIDNTERDKTEEIKLAVKVGLKFDSFDELFKEKFDSIYLDLTEYRSGLERPTFASSDRKSIENKIKNKIDEIIEKAGDREVVICVPKITKSKEIAEYKNLLAKYRKKIKLQVGNLGQIYAFSDFVKIGDYSLNCLNSVTAERYAKDLERITLSVELSEKEISDLHGCKKECILDGYIESLTSENCMVKSSIGCKNSNTCFDGTLGVKDEKGYFFPLFTDTKCRTHIFNPHRLRIIDRRGSLKTSVQRLDLMLDSDSDVISVVRAYAKNDVSLTKKGCTHGHYLRGVE